MRFPEFKKSEVNSMKASKAFWLGIFSRVFVSRKQKVFIVGFHKTGTSSMGKSLTVIRVFRMWKFKGGKSITFN